MCASICSRRAAQSRTHGAPRGPASTRCSHSAISEAHWLTHCPAHPLLEVVGFQRGHPGQVRGEGAHARLRIPHCRARGERADHHGEQVGEQRLRGGLGRVRCRSRGRVVQHRDSEVRHQSFGVRRPQGQGKDAVLPAARGKEGRQQLPVVEAEVVAREVAALADRRHRDEPHHLPAGADRLVVLFRGRDALPGLAAQVQQRAAAKAAVPVEARGGQQDAVRAGGQAAHHAAVELRESRRARGATSAVGDASAEQRLVGGRQVAAGAQRLLGPPSLGRMADASGVEARADRQTLARILQHGGIEQDVVVARERHLAGGGQEERVAVRAVGRAESRIRKEREGQHLGRNALRREAVEESLLLAGPGVAQARTPRSRLERGGSRRSANRRARRGEVRPRPGRRSIQLRTLRATRAGRSRVTHAAQATGAAESPSRGRASRNASCETIRPEASSSRIRVARSPGRASAKPRRSNRRACSPAERNPSIDSSSSASSTAIRRTVAPSLTQKRPAPQS